MDENKAGEVMERRALPLLEGGLVVVNILFYLGVLALTLILTLFLSSQLPIPPIFSVIMLASLIFLLVCIFQIRRRAKSAPKMCIAYLTIVIISNITSGAIFFGEIDFVSFIICGLMMIPFSNKERNERIFIYDESSSFPSVSEETSATHEEKLAPHSPQPATITMEELNEGPKDAHAYISKMMVEFSLAEEADLATLDKPLAEYRDFQKALFFADEDYKKILEGYAKSVDENIALKNQQKRYEEALHSKESAEYQMALEAFKQLDNYKDSEQLADECIRLQKNKELAEMEAAAMERKKARTYTIVVVVLIALAALFILFPKTSITPQNTSVQKQETQKQRGTITRNYTRVRSTPDTSKDDNIVHSAFNGDVVEILGYKDIGGLRWYEVSFIDIDKRGWILSSYLDVGK